MMRITALAVMIGLFIWAIPVQAGDWSWSRIMELGDQITVPLPPGPYLVELRPAAGADCVNVHFRFEDETGEPVRGFRGTPCRGQERRATIEAAPRGKPIRQVVIQCSVGPAEAVVASPSSQPVDHAWDDSQAGGDRQSGGDR